MDDFLVDAPQVVEWRGMCVRNDQVDPESIQDGTDLAKPEFEARIICYPTIELHGQLIFMGILSSLNRQAIITGDLFSEGHDNILYCLRWFRRYNASTGVPIIVRVGRHAHRACQRRAAWATARIPDGMFFVLEVAWAPARWPAAWRGRR